MIDVVAYRRRTEELEAARRPRRVDGRVARELDLLRRDEVEARRDRAEAEIRAAFARAEVEATAITTRYRRAKVDEERRAAALLRGS